ncbi:MAG: hypothetical protein KDA59_25025 [Planctomycetales bacterium]|nr:hypothetical protein [Planctomycetales bacterium]
MALLAPFLVIEALAADVPSTTGTSLETSETVVLAAVGAARRTVGAVMIRTRRAITVTVLADRVTAAPAVIGLVIGDGIATVGAGHAIPFGKRNEGTAAVVRAQQTGDDQEEVQQPRALQGPRDRLPSIPFTQFAVTHVRIRDAFVRRRGMGNDRKHFKARPIRAAQFRPVQLDAKRPQVQAVEFDGFRRHGDQTRFELDVDRFEFLLQGQEIAVDISYRSQRIRAHWMDWPNLTTKLAELSVEQQQKLGQFAP